MRAAVSIFEYDHTAARAIRASAVSDRARAMIDEHVDEVGAAGAVEAGRKPALQTLERGLAVLELLSRSGPLSIADIVDGTGLHRSIVYRIVRTLEQHEFAERDANGRYGLGLALAFLGHAVRQDLQSAALPELTSLAGRTGCTAFVVVPHAEEAVTLLTVEPPRAADQLVYRPGRRHPLGRGAPGLAILAGLPPQAGERPEVRAGREAGYVRTTGEVIPGLTSLAAPVSLADGSAASVAIVFVDGHVDEGAAIGWLRRTASRLSGVASGA
jgi:DNA-binding IclR family transcriptional regulator